MALFIRPSEREQVADLNVQASDATEAMNIIENFSGALSDPRKVSLGFSSLSLAAKTIQYSAYILLILADGWAVAARLLAELVLQRPALLATLPVPKPDSTQPGE